MVLLDRISDLLDQSMGVTTDKKSASDQGTPGAKGTSGTLKVGQTTAGQVSVDRATLDEIKAEIDQLRTMLSDKIQWTVSGERRAVASPTTDH